MQYQPCGCSVPCHCQETPRDCPPPVTGYFPVPTPQAACPTPQPCQPGNTVREFLDDCYGIISPSQPSQSLRGIQFKRGLKSLNGLLAFYGLTGFLLPVSDQIIVAVAGGQRDVFFSDCATMPCADWTGGRIAAMQNAWLTFNGVVYPLYDRSRNRFNNMARPLNTSGLPLEYIIHDEVNYTRLELFPPPSRPYLLHIDAKFAASYIDENSTMPQIPQYYRNYFEYAVAKEIAYKNAMANAWTQDLQATLDDKERIVINNTPVNVDIGNKGYYLTGAALVESGLFLYE